MDKNRITVRKERKAKTFKPKGFLYFGLAAIGVGCYYFFTQFNSERIEEWLPLGIILVVGLLLTIAHLKGSKFPGSEDFWMETEFVIDRENKLFKINFSNSNGVEKNQVTADISEVEHFEHRIDTSSRTVKSSEVVHDPMQILPKGQASTTGTYVEITTKNYVERKVMLILQPSGAEIKLKSTPENLEEFVKQLNDILNG
ncbi:MAG: hypothetical protein Crog4KO_12450 [Crocinitomicaceae bacterium]